MRLITNFTYSVDKLILNVVTVNGVFRITFTGQASGCELLRRGSILCCRDHVSSGLERVIKACFHLKVFWIGDYVLLAFFIVFFRFLAFSSLSSLRLDSFFSSFRLRLRVFLDFFSVYVFIIFLIFFHLLGVLSALRAFRALWFFLC